MKSERRRTKSEGMASDEVQSAWDKEIEQRLQGLRSGQVKGVPLEEVQRKIKARSARECRTSSMPPPGIALVLAGMLLVVSGCAAPPEAVRFDNVEIRGTSEFNKQVENALGLLKTNSPTGYAIVTNHVGIIEQAKRSGMRAFSKPPKFELNDRTAFYSLTWCAGTIAHDSFHSKLYADYLKEHPKGRVPDKIWMGEEAEKRCLEHQVAVLKEIGAPTREVVWCGETNRYWEVKYRNRTW